MSDGYNLTGDIEIIRVFGLLQFGAASSGWDDEVFFRRTGIALKLHAERMKPDITGI